MEIHKGNQTGKGTNTRTLCQKIERSAEAHQRPIKMDSGTVYRILPSKATPFQTGVTDDPICERCLEEDESATYVLSDCEAIAHLRFHHLGQFFMEPGDYYGAPHK
jgi:hypothetical protein